MVKVALVRQAQTRGARDALVAAMLQYFDGQDAAVTILSRTSEGWGARRVLQVDPFHVGALWRDWSFARAARRKWRREGFDIVQAYDRIAGCDVYVAADGPQARSLHPHRRYLHGAEKAVLEHPRLRAVICPSHKVRDAIRRGFRIAPEKLHVIYGGVDLERFHPRERERLRGAARARLGCRPRDTVFLLASSDAAADAMAALAGTGVDRFWLLVCGDDRSGRRIEALAQAHGLAPRVAFVGAPEDLRPHYAAADCLIVPASDDPFPGVVLEALAMGLPAIVSARSGAAEIIEEGANGWVRATDDAQSLASALRSADEAMRGATVSSATRASAERFGIANTVRQLGELYASL